MLALLRANRARFREGVVHSFDGSAEEAAELVALGLHIGLNGCSLKTEENLRVAAGIPAERLLLETDCPWCEIRPTHAVSQTAVPISCAVHFD
jgi:TatD DNase family protein